MKGGQRRGSISGNGAGEAGGNNMFDLPKQKMNFAASIIPTGGQFIENKNSKVSQSFAQVIGKGLGNEGSSAFNRKTGVLGELAEDTHLPDELEDDFKDYF